MGQSPPSPIVASYIESLSPYVPGKPIEEVAREYGVPDCAKLASNENPLGASPLALTAIRDALERVHLYPDGSCFALKRKLAALHGAAPEEIVVGAGTNEILTLLVRTFLAEGEEAVLSENTFLVYRLAVQSCGRRAAAVPMRGHRYDLDAMAAAIGPRTKLVFIANPDNPNGTYVSEVELTRFLDRVPERVLVVLDEAYFEFVDAADYPDGVRLRRHRPRLVVLRTFSKIHGLAGLRVGYGLCERDVANYLDRVRDPFNVSSLAQVAAVAALDDHAHVEATRVVTREGRDLLMRELPRFGFQVVPSVANFVLALTGQSGEALFQGLLRHGVIVRPMTAYGMPEAVRISIGTPAENQRLLRALEKVVDTRRRAAGDRS
ncbi:MAG TPA: histidinol-phosphate transaminase [Myxococcales bacterium]|nr:histidinol-phosphate transaminase [Myxococcales bacterium]